VGRFCGGAQRSALVMRTPASVSPSPRAQLGGDAGAGRRNDPA